MKSLPVLILFLLVSINGWADLEILKQEHTRLQDYHTAWGKGFDHLAPSLSSQSTANDKTNLWDTLPVNENHTDIVTASGFSWCMVQTNNQWNLMESDINNKNKRWQNVSKLNDGEVIGFKINQDGNLSLLTLDAEINHFSIQTASIHSGGNQITWDEPIRLIGNQTTAKQEWEKRCGSEPMMMNEFDLGESGEFLAVSHSVSKDNLTVRYRISPEMGMPYGEWSAPIPAGSMQLKKDGRILQYQVISDEESNWDELPHFSITYTYPENRAIQPDSKEKDNPPTSGMTEHNLIDPKLELNNLNQTEMELKSNEDDQPNQTDMEKDVVSASNDSPKQEKRDNGSRSEKQRDDQTSVEKKEDLNQDKQDGNTEQQDQEELIGQQSDELKQNSDTQDLQDSNPTNNKDEQQKQDQQPNENPHDEKPNEENPQNKNPPSDQPNKNESADQPEFASPFNQLIGKPNQQSDPSPKNENQDQPARPQSDPNVKPSSKPQPSDSANSEDQNDVQPESQNNEEINMTDNSGDGNPSNPSQSSNNDTPAVNEGSQPSSSNQNGNGNDQGDEPSNPEASAGMPGDDAADQPQSGMPQEQGDAPGFQFPNMGGDGNGSSYHQKPYSPQKNHASASSTGSGRTGNQNPHRESIASPTIAFSTPAVSPVISLLKNEEQSSAPKKTAVPLAGGAGLLSILFIVRRKKRKSQVNVDPEELEDAEENLLHDAVDEFTSGEKSLYTLIPKNVDSVWDHAIAFDSSVTAADVMENRIITLHDDGCLRLDQQDAAHSKTTLLGKWNKQGLTPQLASSGLPFFAVGLNAKGQINICQGKQAVKSYVEEQKSMPLPKNLHTLKQINIKHNKLWLMGEAFGKNILLSATIEHGKIRDWKAVKPQDAPDGQVIGYSSTGRDLIAFAADEEPELVRIYQRDVSRGGWEMIAKCHYSGGQVCLCIDEKRCFMSEWLDHHNKVSIHAFTRDHEGRFAGQYVNEVELPFDAKVTSGSFQNGKIILHGIQTTPKGETRIVSCGASIRKLLGVPIAAN